MDSSKYSELMRGILQSSQTYALAQGHQSFMPEHVLHVFLQDGQEVACSLIRSSGGDLQKLKKINQEQLSKTPKVTGGGAQIYLSQPLAGIFSKAEEVIKKSGDSFVTIEKFLLAMMLVEGSVAQSLKQCGVSVDRLQSAIKALRKGRVADSVNAEQGFDALKKYCRDLTQEAREGKLDPVIGRDDEMRRIIQVLSRRTKNNPVLIGDPGVGKTAIVEGLATRIINGDVPESLKGRRLMALDMGALIAGAKFRGEFEERLKSLLSEVRSENGEVVLFIDEMHTLIGAGKTDGAMDASNLLKPSLARGELHCIGATTLDEYRKHVEKDPALARRFQPVTTGEPTVEDTVSILRGLKERYEQHHKVRISDSALVSAAVLSNRYITDRFLPDKAIDLMDEASARVRMQIDTKPEELDELDRRIVHLKIEKEALKKEKDQDSKERLLSLEKELVSLEEKEKVLSLRWQEGKRKLGYAADLKKRLESMRNELAIAQRQGEFQRAGELAYGLIPKTEKELEDAEKDDDTSKDVIQEVVNSDNIASVVSRWTGIPIHKMLESDREKFLRVEEEISKTVIGQSAAIASVSNALRRSRAGLSDPKRPMGSFVFLGSTGVGKTELAKALAQFLFDEESAMVRIDMSEYMEKHSVSRLIGAPPGYVGYEEGGALTEAVRRRPYQVILFDEIEKAHPDIHNVLLQVLDDGRLTDSQGHTVDFRNTLIIMTSNLGAEYLAEDQNDEESDSLYKKIMGVVRSTFKPEFLNRLDEVILFQRLRESDMEKIVRIQLKRILSLILERHISIDFDSKVIDWLSRKGYDPVYGARPLKRVIQRYVQNPLAEKILSTEISDGSSVEVSIGEDYLDFRVVEKNLADSD
ncbi:ATP-dependent chaperone ClpB [Candidatus Liberibacter sp.]|uniref:ATP-dependent chaperone ClpB n=1 Tax=Candidatus Liberibacter sp. TaxID=34022 RepID=UPI0015F4B201|nr:ATP-dependent chaperone ClpB [Candidatus Liberibacter sp.]MBA5723830.1 ATP-dependent chaperone ClpB [Candidatus Liberibacter sp.]